MRKPRGRETFSWNSSTLYNWNEALSRFPSRMNHVPGLNPLKGAIHLHRLETSQAKNTRFGGDDMALARRKTSVSPVLSIVD